MRLLIARMRLPAVFLLAATAFAQQAAPPPLPPDPVVNADHSVSFHFKAPDVPKVVLALENHPPVPMQKNADGIWTFTTEPLRSEYYSYHFVVNGQNVLDPLNPKLAQSITAAGNVLLIPGPDTDSAAAAPGQPIAAGPALWEHSAVPHGVLHRHAFTTAVAVGLPENQSEFYVYTPPGYDPRSSTKYPVLYLLHGYFDSGAGWTGTGHADNILDNLIAQGKARPMIVVMPLGYGDYSFLLKGFGVWQDRVAIERNTTLFSQSFLTEVMPRAEKLYNISARREDHAIAGLSMGGLEGLTVGLSHPELFAWVGGFSAAVHAVQPGGFPVLNPKTANLKLVYISVGLTDSLLEADRKYAAAIRAEGIPVTTVETPGVGHVWQQWRPDLVTFASTIFQ